RKDTILYVVLEGPPTPPRILEFDGSTLSGMDYHEQAIAHTIKKVLGGKTHTGITLHKKSFEALIKELAPVSQLCYLDPDGTDVRDVEFNQDVTIILGDYIGMPNKSEKFLDRFELSRITLGP